MIRQMLKRLFIPKGAYCYKDRKKISRDGRTIKLCKYYRRLYPLPLEEKLQNVAYCTLLKRRILHRCKACGIKE